jgi:hypothetical protein
MSDFSVAALQSMFNSSFNGTKSGTISDTQNGAGTFSTVISHQNGVATYDETITYADGKTVEEQSTITQNSDGSLQDVTQKYVNGVASGEKTVDTSIDGDTLSKTSEKLKADGSVKSTTTTTLTANADGTETLSGTRTNAKGNVSDITGTVSKSAAGTDRSETITNAAGKTEAINDLRTLSNGTMVNTRTGVTFGGVAFSDTTTKTLLDVQKST